MQLILRELEEQNIPHILFLNKIDKADKRVRDTLALLQAGVAHTAGAAPDADLEGRHRAGLRRSRAGTRLRLSRTHAVRGGRRSKASDLEREKEARFSMLEKLADHDDALMEQLLEDVPPPRDLVFDDLARELRDGIICPVLLGSATRANGVLRLMKALRHEAPDVAQTAARLGVKRRRSGRLCDEVRRTPSMAANCRVVRVLSGQIVDGATLISPDGEAGRISGLFVPVPGQPAKKTSASAGDTRRAGEARTCADRRHAHRRQEGA